MSNNEELSKVVNSSEDGLFLLRTRLRFRQQMLLSAIQKKEEEITRRRLKELAKKQKRDGTEVFISPKKARNMDEHLVDITLDDRGMEKTGIVTTDRGIMEVENTDETDRGVITDSVKDTSVSSRDHQSGADHQSVANHQPVTNLQSINNSPQDTVQSVSTQLTVVESQQQDCCPICNVPFSSDMSLTQRTRHVEKCLNRTQAPSSNPIPPPLPSDDDLWDQESDHEMPRGQMDVRCTHGKRVLIDDGDDRFYFTLLYKYLLWRQAERNLDSEKAKSFFTAYNEQASVMNEWIPSGHSPSSSELKSALSNYYKEEPAYLLASGCLIPRHLFDTLYPYQQQGVSWLLRLHQQQVGGILADEMGLGKTIQIVAALIALKFSWEAKCCGRDFQVCPRGDEGKMEEQPIELNTLRLSSLLVVPATLLGHWMRELRCWCPLLRAVVIHSMSETVSEGASLQMVLTQCRAKHRFDIVITTYEGLRSSALYRKQDWFYAILDEGGKIKNSKVNVSQKCRQLRTVHRLLISGTPLQNNLKELWSLFDFVYPGRLGTQEAFISTYVVPISRGIYSNASLQQSQLGYQMSIMLQDTISPFILRRLKRV